MRHKVDWDYVEWLLAELDAQLVPKIAVIKAGREKARLATAKSREKPEVYAKHLAYQYRYRMTKLLKKGQTQNEEQAQARERVASPDEEALHAGPDGPALLPPPRDETRDGGHRDGAEGE